MSKPLVSVQTLIDDACRASDRSPGDVTLIAVSKVQPLERIHTVLDAGHRVFGENRVQEAAGKWPELRDRFGKLELHLIGPLQSNKINKALDLFDAIHTIDRPSLAQKLAHAVQARGRCPKLFIQVNTGLEPQKAGVAPDALDELLTECRKTYDLPISGLMTIPPVDQPAAPHFRLLHDLAAAHGLRDLSMGMSSDFATAIANGATHVRVGSAIFGARATP